MHVKTSIGLLIGCIPQELTCSSTFVITQLNRFALFPLGFLNYHFRAFVFPKFDNASYLLKREFLSLMPTVYIMLKLNFTKKNTNDDKKDMVIER